MEGHDGSINTTLGPPLFDLTVLLKPIYFQTVDSCELKWKLSIHTELIN
jgi:hypothetical protein